MRYDIVPLGQTYRGMARSLTPLHLRTPKTKKRFEELLEIYFFYIELCENVSQSAFESMLTCYNLFCTYGIPCEIIVYDDIPIDNAFGYPIELLGIDIVHDMCESLISDSCNPGINHLLNENGLCKTVEDIERIIPFQDCGIVNWSPCYVYRVIGQGTELCPASIPTPNHP